MPLLTLKAQVHADPETERILRDAMFCATKVYKGGIETLPGLPKVPQALGIDVDEEGNIRGMDY